ncbi:hypothetical protein [Brevundimonas lutea]|uniref:hypothetical protein n=1 Tax=Brevundimonas lutea TaxID=2293980 RepID=UPI000F0185FD|nr:hypothetical protein [Brevundimonas lutea]
MPEIEFNDDQEQSETFDETHLDDDGDGDVTLEEVDVMDVTQAQGDADDEDQEEMDLDDVLGADGVDPAADDLNGLDSPRLAKIDGESDDARGSDEVELVYTGLMRNVKGAQASAAHWEAKRLSDDDIEGLGYGPDEETEK